MNDSLIGQYGFKRLSIPPMGHYRSYSYLWEDIGVFDVHPANCVETAAGILVPIDFVLVRFDADTVAELGRRVG